MELRMPHRNMLKRLENFPTQLKTFTHGDTNNSQMSVHFERYLNELQNWGLVININDVWHITGFGLAALHEKKDRVTPARIASGTTTESYDGKDLRNTCGRKGAYDFLKYPSKIGGTMVYPKISV